MIPTQQVMEYSKDLERLRQEVAALAKRPEQSSFAGERRHMLRERMRWTALGVAGLLLLPLRGEAEIPNLDMEADFTGTISGQKMYDNFVEVETRLSAPMVQSDVTSGGAINAEQIVAELAIVDELETIGGPVRLDFVPTVGGANGASIQATSATVSCGVTLVIERQTEPADDWVPIATPNSLLTTGTGACNNVVPPASFSTVDVEAPAGTHRYRVRVVPLSGSAVYLESFKMVAYELRGVLP